ncbi:MAG TPA: class I SAM-dependent methyltransferase [Ardenticatenaceae bacterium]|jgi:SAM-dependent methyltransferase
MRATSFERKASPEAAWWQSDYLVMSALLRDLANELPGLRGDLLDLGCGNRPYQPLLTSVSSYLPYDIETVGSTPEVVGTAEGLPFAAESFDSVLCTQVLEHVAQPWMMVSEIARVLRPGGRVLLSAPQAWRLHEQPYDYYRYTRYGLESLLNDANLSVVSCREQGGAWAVVGQVVNNHLWRHAPPKYSPRWWLGRLSTGLVNLVAARLDAAFFDPEETLNYVLLAERERSLKVD